MKPVFLTTLFTVSMVLVLSFSGCATDWTSIVNDIFTTPAETGNGGTVTPPEPAGPGEIDALLLKLKSADKNVVIKAVERLGNIDNGSTPVLNEFRRLLTEHPSTKVKQAVLDESYAFDRRAPMLPGLAVCLKHANEDIRIDSCDMIGDIEKPLSIDILIEGLSNPHADVRENSQDGLEFFTDKEFTTKAQWKAWWDRSRGSFKF